MKEDGDRAVLERALTYTTLLLLAGTAFIIPTSLLPARDRNRALRAEVQVLEAQVEAGGRAVGELEAEQEALRHDPYLVERLLRRDYRWVEPGDLVIPVETAGT
jgi:cell division protein FtsB